MTTSLILLLKFVYDIVKRLIHDAYFRALGTVLLLMVLIGTLFFWLVEDNKFLHALTYAVGTLAMNSPYGTGWGPQTPGGIVFNIIYLFLGVGLFLLFVLEAGKTMIQTYEEFTRKMAERKAKRRARKRAAANTMKGEST
jgi:voltage-gated potassium channel